MQTAFDVMHTIVRNGVRDRKGIGIFANFNLAAAAIESLKNDPGFNDPRGFFGIYSCTIGKPYLPNGLDAQPPVLEHHPEADPTIFNCSLSMAYQLYNETTNNQPVADDDFVLIGLYASKQLAEAEMQHLISSSILNGPDRRYGISTKTLNSTHWQGGF
jgi:hypothetical protein